MSKEFNLKEYEKFTFYSKELEKSVAQKMAY